MCLGYVQSSQKIYHGQEISQKYLLSLAIREIIIKTILRFTLPQSEWQRLKNKSKQSVTTNVRGGCAEKLTPICSWWDFKIVQAQCKSEWRILKELKINLPYDWSIYTHLWHVPTRLNICSKDTCSGIFNDALFTTYRKWKEPKY